MIEITPSLRIPERELTFTTSRSSGPGGQNVNKVESRVTLWFDLESSAALSDEQRERIRAKLPGRINADGVLRVSSQRHRTQAANRRAATERFAELLRTALERKRKRIPTRKSRAADTKRLEEKRRRKQRKEGRRRPRLDD